MENLIHRLQEFVWGPGMLFFFLATGIRFTVASRFFQIRKLHIWMGKTLGALRHKEVRRAGEEPRLLFSEDRELFFGCGFLPFLE